MENNFFTDLWTAAKQAGPFASILLLFILYVVNEERKNLQKKHDELIIKMLDGLHDTTDAVKELTNLFQQSRRR